MPKQSAGILLYKFTDKQLLVFLVHPGGPFWKNKEEGAWSIPKGEIEEGEDPLATAKREFKEETSQTIDGDFIPLEVVRQRSGKLVTAWAVEGDIDLEKIVSNEFPIEWPPRSGKIIMIPEVDRGEWWDLESARLKINPGQVPLLDNLIRVLAEKQGIL